ncbi:hypothetical protein [Thiolapillus sp.]|nr:hypothetical protein [Thiolapillus sp.]
MLPFWMMKKVAALSASRAMDSHSNGFRCPGEGERFTRRGRRR